ncbi:MAG: WecB/TagA/CpsF family glycosyltransferase [Armatimonadota bacterium]|nr:WecB/TagA/CpsF family glycosyltransferase [Armatimonadota bacterium]
MQIDAVTMTQAMDAFAHMIRTRHPHLVFNVNVDICMQARLDSELASILRSADLILVDGTPMMWAARLLGTPLPERVSGSDFLPKFCRVAARSGYRIFLLGAGPGVAERAKRALEGLYPDLNIVGTYSPPYGFERDEGVNAQIVEQVRRVAPDVLFTAFGAPKDQKWLYRFRSTLDVPISMGVGSSLDYLAGRLKRAPRWMQVLGLEWTYRLAQEPRRLWRRYLINDPPFFYHLAREVVRRRATTHG